MTRVKKDWSSRMRRLKVAAFTAAELMVIGCATFGCDRSEPKGDVEHEEKHRCNVNERSGVPYYDHS